MTKINSDARVAEAFKYFATKKTSKEFTWFKRQKYSKNKKTSNVWLKLLYW